MKIESIRLIHAFDRDTGSKLLLNGYELTSVNYDEHGSAGAELLGQFAEALSKVSNIRVQENHVSDDEFDRIGGA